MNQNPQHIPVLLNEIIDMLSPESEGIYIDGTIGLGGHTSAILDASIPNGRVIGIDLDPYALELTSDRLGDRNNRLTLVHGNFRDLDQILTQNSVSAVDGILLDLGVSSMQLNTPDRGFSFLSSGQLDMRMNPNQRVSALKIVNETKTEQLANIIYEFGEERWSRRIARAIERVRKTSKITTTQQLAETISAAIPRKKRYQRIHPATRTFQALRIAVNQELESLDIVLNHAITALKSGGKLCVISFHSLEDRIVKRRFRELAKPSNDLNPQLAHQKLIPPPIEIVTKRPITASEEEISKNPRARSAKLRVCTKICESGITNQTFI